MANFTALFIFAAGIFTGFIAARFIAARKPKPTANELAVALIVSHLRQARADAAIPAFTERPNLSTIPN